MFGTLLAALRLTGSLLFTQCGLILPPLLGLLYYYLTKDHDYFKIRGIRYVAPKLLVGNQGKVLTRRTTFWEYYDELYRANKDVGIVGVFEMVQPTYMIKDPALIKQILIKDFDSFVNRRFKVDPESDPVFAKNLFGASDQIWRELRLLLSPAFTGAKMRFIFDLVRDCADRTVQQVERDMIRGEYPFDARDFFTRCATDVISTSAFGMELNSFEATDNVIYRNGVRLLDFGFLESMKFFLYITCPGLMNFFKIPIFHRESSDKLKTILMEVVRQREQQGGHRPDMVQLLLQAKHKGHVDGEHHQTTSGATSAKTTILDDDYFAAQCMVFFLAGFETVSQFFSFAAYELALNADVQKTLQAEIDAMDGELTGASPTYEQIQKMSYLDMTVQEVLRKWPPVIFIDRACNRPVTLQDSAGQKVTLQPGELVVFPTYSYHHDSEYFPNPETFDPLRFSEENKRPEHQFVYQPFGLGPRQCIANRFALMEAKIFVYHLLLRFDIVKNVRTLVPLPFEKGVTSYRVPGGIQLSFKARGRNET